VGDALSATAFEGKHEWIYQLDRKGFDLGKRCWGLDGPYIEAEAKWRPRHVTEYSVVEHDLQVNAWVMAFRELAGDRVIDWRGPRSGPDRRPDDVREPSLPASRARGLQSRVG
jgi:hypothetical protein